MSALPKLPDVIELLRPDDLLNLRIVPENLRLERDPPMDDPGRAAGASANASLSLVVHDPDRPALLRVMFPPQHIAEFAAFESSTIAEDANGSDDSLRDAHNRRTADNLSSPTVTDPDPLPLPGTDNFKARIAASSRLVFRVPEGRRIPYTVAGLLDWRGLDVVLHPIASLDENASDAQRAAAPAISAPTASQTALELPYRLVISPGNAYTWAHRARPFGAHGRYELWHTRLVAPTDDGCNELDLGNPAPLRALWSPDYQPDPKPGRNRDGTATIGSGKAGRSALADDDRHQLVVLTSAFHGYETDLWVPLFPTNMGGQYAATARPVFIKIGSTPYVPKPFRASQVMLSALGGWLKSSGEWTPPHSTLAAKPSRFFDMATSAGLRQLTAAFARADTSPTRLRDFIVLPDAEFVPDSVKQSGQQLDLSEWVHVATQGRDHYVRVVYEGELWPFHHRASMVKVTERKFRQLPGGIVVACLVQRVFIVVREPEKTVHRFDLNLKKVRLTTRVTPDLAEPEIFNGPSPDPDPKQEPDSSPDASPAPAPAIERSFWVEVGPSKDKKKFLFHAVGTDHDDKEHDFTIPLIFASISDTAEAASTHEIDRWYNAASDRAADFLGQKLAFTRLEGSENPLLATRKVFFEADSKNPAPRMLSAAVTIPSLAALLGKNAQVRIAYDDTGADSYARNGDFVPANQTQVFAKLIDKLPLGFRADQAGGFATPNQTLTGLSRANGPIAGDIAKAMMDTFEPDKVFPAVAPAGVPALPLLFGTFGLDKLLKGGSLSGQAPKITTAREGTAVVTRLKWEPEVEPSASVGVADFIKGPSTSKIEISGETRVPLDTAQPSSRFEGKLEDFDIVLLKSVTIHFTAFAFTSRNGEKPDVKVALSKDKPLEFSGDLKFVEDLRKVIPPGLFGDGASLEVATAGIRAGFAVGLPPLEIGVFALKDISLAATLTLPFLDGKPVLDFNVSERAKPFLLRVAFFAGSGFFHLQMDTLGMRQLEVSLEFGAAFGLSIAVATGEVHAMAGIYFAITRKNLPDNKSENLCTLTGFMRLGGRLSVIGIIRLSVEFNLSFTYQEESDKAYGRATVTVMVEVLFISVSVALTVERAFGGATDPVFLQTFPEHATWHEYASAFA